MSRDTPYNFTNIVAPSTPVAGERRVYFDTAKGMVVRTSAGTTFSMEAPLVKAGTPVDGDFTVAYDGLLAVNTTDKRWYVRIAGVWTPLTDLASLVLTTYIAIGTNPATADVIRIPNAEYLTARNAANSANKRLIGLNASDLVAIGSSGSDVTFGGLIRDSFVLGAIARPGVTFSTSATGNNEDMFFLAVYRGGTNLTRFQVNQAGSVDIQPGGDSTFTVGTNKMVVTAASGDTSIAGNLAVTGTITGSNLAPTAADYLVGTAQGGLSAEIVVGTTPGGELGGTWASPTIDATHSGSAHPVDATTTVHGLITANDQKRLTVQALGNITGATTIDLSLGDTIRATLIGNVSITLTNPVSDHDYLFEFIQDGTGSRTVTWTTTVKWPGGVTPVATTTINKKDLFLLHRDTADYLGNATLNF